MMKKNSVFNLNKLIKISNTNMSEATIRPKKHIAKLIQTNTKSEQRKTPRKSLKSYRRSRRGSRRKTRTLNKNKK